MSSLRTYAILWFSGLFAGVVIMERWRRTGKRLIPEPPSAGDGVETATSDSPSRDTPKVTTVLVAGAKADAQRVHHFVKRLTVWTTNSAPSVAELRRWSQNPPPGPSAPSGGESR
jgi:hypothetical protein